MLRALHPHHHRGRDCAGDPEAVGDGEEAAGREEKVVVETLKNDEEFLDVKGERNPVSSAPSSSSSLSHALSTFFPFSFFLYEEEDE